nr:MAG: serine/threonine protein kinase [Leptolyngbya sp. IPPAS B-1204]
MVTAGSELTPGTLVDRRYRIQCTLGRGGFGRTYLAADERRFNELCVLKEFVPNSQADPVVAQKLRELFQREAAILHQLNHPQIPKFFAGFEEDERLFIAQEYIDGKTYWRLLQERQRQGCSFNQREIVAWLWSLLRVLDYLHSQNIVHRDISPDNIMLPKGKTTPVLIDFGVVKQVIPHLHVANPSDPDDLIQASVSVGKFGYAPYEQIRMGQCSPRSDLYALAVTAVVLLTGKPPNHLLDSKSLEWKWKRLVRLDARLLRILEMMMADKPQDRYATAQAVLQALQPLYEALDSLELWPVSPAKRTNRAKQTATGRRTANQAHPPTQLELVKADAVVQKQARNVAADLNSANLSQLNREATADWVTQATAVTGHLLTTQLDPQPDSPVTPLLAEQATISQTISPTISHQGDATLANQALSAQLAAQPTQIEAAIVPAPKQTLAWSRMGTDIAGTNVAETDIAETDIADNLRPLSFVGRLQQIRAAILHLPQDQRGNARRPLRMSLRQAVVLGALALLPVGGVLVGIRSPYLVPLCWALENCVGEQSAEERYRQALEQASSASILIEQARDLQDLQNARPRLADSIAQLNTVSGSSKVYRAASAVLPRYQALLETLDYTLEKETRAAQLLHRAEAEAQKAAEQTKVATTLQQFQAAQLQWRRALATLEAIPDGSFVRNPASARTQEYQARLDAVNLKVAAATPKSPQPSTATQPTPQPNLVGQSTQRPSPMVSVAAAIPAPAQPAPAQSTSQPATAPAQKPQPPARPASQPTNRSTSRSNRPAARPTQSTPPRSAATTVAQQTPHTSPLEIANRWVAGSFLTSATQTLNDVSVWIDGKRTEADGKFIANLWIQNRSGRGFSFVPLYAESRDSNGNTVRSRVLFTGTGDTMLEPGELLNGQIYLLDQPANRRLTLVIQESTSGDRTFRIPL